ncbi:MAG: preprotein translocase subunit Sec61beta [Halobacteriales archaeon]|nr:preprotein translocase subunit Sec61beta [Halobacteriales archaeon]
MSSGERSGGMMSSAGLIQYYESEDRRAIRIDAKTILAVSIAFGFVVQALNFAYM